MFEFFKVWKQRSMIWKHAINHADRCMRIKAFDEISLATVWESVGVCEISYEFLTVNSKICCSSENLKKALHFNFMYIFLYIWNDNNVALLDVGNRK